MRREHPLWRGFWLAAVMAAGLVLLPFADTLGPFRLDRRLLAYAGAIAAGSLLGAVPALLRQFLRKKPRPPRVPFPWQRCLRGLLCGLALALALGLAGDGRILPALLTGSAGGYGFCLAALISGFITVRIMGRARA